MTRTTKRIQIFDSTLRDGAQGEGISYSVTDKLNIVRALDDFKVDYIEAGNPASNPKDMAFFEKVTKEKLHHARLCAFGATHRKGLTADKDAGLKSLLDAGTPCVSIFGKTWDLHVEKILRATLEENLGLIYRTVKFMKDNGKEVIFDAEHFFDGFIRNEEYALST